MVLCTKEHSQHLNVTLLRALTKQIHTMIQSQIAKARQPIAVAYPAEGGVEQPFDGSDGHLKVPIGFSQWLSTIAVGLCEDIGDQLQQAAQKKGEPPWMPNNKTIPRQTAADRPTIHLHQNSRESPLKRPCRESAHGL